LSRAVHERQGGAIVDASRFVALAASAARAALRKPVVAWRR
jgi:hypothetical protein